MDRRDFTCVSIRGMVTYCVMCLENYVLEAYADHDFAQNADRFMEAIPEYLFEFDDYGAAGFEHLTESEFNELRGLLDPDDEVLGLLMHRIYDVAMCYAYTAVEVPPREAVDLVFDSIGCLREHGISLPDFELVRGFSFNEYDGWGAHVNPEGLSRVL